MPLNDLSAQDVRAELRYDSDTGVFYRVHSGKGYHAGSVAGHKRPTGYVRISVLSKLYYAHRLAWLYMTGEWPANEVDHINGDPSDNRWCNLRAATARENRGNTRAPKNNTTGVKGVHYYKNRGKWTAYVARNRRTKCLGYFDTIEEAAAARRAAAKLVFGDFSRDK